MFAASRQGRRAPSTLQAMHKPEDLYSDLDNRIAALAGLVGGGWRASRLCWLGFGCLVLPQRVPAAVAWKADRTPRWVGGLTPAAALRADGVMRSRFRCLKSPGATRCHHGLQSSLELSRESARGKRAILAGARLLTSRVSSIRRRVAFPMFCRRADSRRAPDAALNLGSRSSSIRRRAGGRPCRVVQNIRGRRANPTSGSTHSC